MQYRKLGNSGLELSVLSLGSWMNFGERIDDNTAEALMHEAYDAGVNFFDNAEVYAGGKSEIVMGNILHKANWDRSSYVVSSKVFWGGSKPNQQGLSRKHIVDACNAALSRLQVDYLDLYFCHRADLTTPVEETVSAMTDLIRQGKILYWGTSEWPVARILAAFEAAAKYNLATPVMEQPQYSMLVRERFEREYEQLFALKKYGATIWSPLASGMLTDRFLGGTQATNSRIEDPKNAWLKEAQGWKSYEGHREGVHQLPALAAELGIPMAGLALAWTMKNPNVSTTIMGASSCGQLRENLKAVDQLPLVTPEVMEKIDGLLANKPDLRDWQH